MTSWSSRAAIRARRVRIGAQQDLGIAPLVTPQQPEEQRQIQDQQRAGDEQRQRHADRVQQIAQPPAEWGRLRRAQGQRACPPLLGDELDQPAADGLRRVAGNRSGIRIEPAQERFVQRRLLADLAHRSADPVDVIGRDRMLPAAQPGEQIGAGVETLAAPEDLPQPGTAGPRQLDKKRVGRSVAIGEQRQSRPRAQRRKTMDPDIVGARIAQNDEPRQMQPVEFSERHQRIVRIGPARQPIERAEQCVQLLLSPLGDRRDDQHGRLRQHGAIASSGIRAGHACRPRRVRCRIHALALLLPRCVVSKRKPWAAASGPVETKPTFSRSTTS